MSIIPKLQCPPDYSILSFRLVDSKCVGIVKGITKEVAICLPDFFIPVTEFAEQRITLKPGQVQRVDGCNIFNYGEQNETYSFAVNDLANIADGTTHTITIYSSEDGSILYTTSFVVVFNPTTTTFLQALYNYYVTDTTLQSYVTLVQGDALTQSFSFVAKTAGVKQIYRFGFNTASIAPFYHPGNLTLPYKKWENGRLKVIFLIAYYANKFTPTNQKNFQWAFDDDYKKLIKPSTWNTGVLTDDASSLNPTFTWLDTFDVGGNLTSYNTRPPYRIAVNDLIRTDKSNAASFVNSINAYDINLVEGIGDGTTGQTIQQLYSPNSITWRTSGEMLCLTGGEEVNSTDKLNIETIWLKNNQTFDIEFKIILAS